VLELIYLQHASSWATKGAATLTLPALDLPISRTGSEAALLAAIQGGGTARSFRLEGDIGPVAEALRAPTAADGRPDRDAAAQNESQRPACRRSSIDSRTAPAAAACPARCPSP
jgi:hypothetical protein